MSDSRVYMMNPKYIKKTIRKVALSIYQYYRVCIYKYNKSNGTKHYGKKRVEAYFSVSFDGLSTADSASYITMQINA